jgi:hypothetical protein
LSKYPSAGEGNPAGTLPKNNGKGKDTDVEAVSMLTTRMVNPI